MKKSALSVAMRVDYVPVKQLDQDLHFLPFSQ